MSFKEEYKQFQKEGLELENRLKEFNEDHAQKIAKDHLEDILAIDGIEGVRILESGNPENPLNRNIKIEVKLSEGARAPNKEYLSDNEGKYFSFYHSDIPEKIENVLGEEYQDTTGVYITDRWHSELLSWETLIAKAIS